MTTAVQLNTQFGVQDQLFFRENTPVKGTPPDTRPAGGLGAASGLIIAEINNRQASASLCLQGAHESNTTFPGHGYARTVPWQVVESSTEINGATRLTLRLVTSI